MEVIPAIDLRDGRCVRLYQGDFSKETVFSEDPVKMALRWQEQGAPRLHLVDLDGAFTGMPGNLSVMCQIAKAVQVPIQGGGGVRNMSTIENYLGLGITRVILGTSAVDDLSFVSEAIRRYGDAIIIGIDARDGYVATSGWTKKSDVRATELASQLDDLGAQRFIYTDISRDGTLTEPNYDAISHLNSLTDSNVICSGGVSSISHLTRLQKVGVEGAIVGRALYTNNIDLREATKAVACEDYHGQGKS